MIRLNDPIWKTLRTANGGTERLVKLLLEMHDGKQTVDKLTDEDWETLWDICHQWTAYDSTVVTLPHLVDIALSFSASTNALSELVTLIAASVLVVKNDKPVAPTAVYDEFDSSMPAAKSLAKRYLEQITSRREMCSGFALLAAINNDLHFAGALLEITDNSIQTLSPIGV